MTAPVPPVIRQALDSLAKPGGKERLRGWLHDRDSGGDWEVTAEWIADALRHLGITLSASSIRTYRRAIKRQEAFHDRHQ